ncbi:unnamed protein product [Boreogadus saida]
MDTDGDDTVGTVAPTACLHIRKMQLKLREAKKKLHTVTEKISDLTKERDSLRQQSIQLLFILFIQLLILN